MTSDKIEEALSKRKDIADRIAVNSDNVYREIKQLKNNRDMDIEQLSRFVPPEIALAKAGYADKFCAQLEIMIKNFESSLDKESDVGVQLVSFGQTIKFYLEFVWYSNPYLIVFKGHTEKGDPVELIQHVSQISILFLKLKREKSLEQKQPIGFGPATMPE